MYRINKLIKLDRKLYHTNDLAVLWDIANKNTLYTTIKRYVRSGILIPVFKGLYATVPLAELDPVELGRAVIHRFTYLTTESVLVNAGLITQVTYPYTFVSECSKKIIVGDISFTYRRLKDMYLHNPAGITSVNGVLTASPERAVGDMLYFNPTYHFDMSHVIDWNAVHDLQKAIGYL